MRKTERQTDRHADWQ